MTDMLPKTVTTHVGLMLIRSTTITIVIVIRHASRTRMSVWAVLDTWSASLMLEGTSHTLLMCPFMPHVKHVLLIGQLRVECSSRAPQVKHYAHVRHGYV